MVDFCCKNKTFGFNWLICLSYLPVDVSNGLLLSPLLFNDLIQPFIP
jgi:hypothetical protein